MEKYFSTLFIIVVVIGVYFIFLRKDTYVGFYYPNQDNLLEYYRSSELKSLEDCRNWISMQSEIRDPGGLGFDYECGKNCKYKKDSDLYVCDETLE